MKCNICEQDKFYKNGFHHGVQRWKCKNCGYQVTKPEARKSQKWVNFAICLYAVGLSFRTIGKIVGVSDVTILNWVRNFAMLNYEKPEPKGEIVIEMDEMWHFVGSKKTNCGFGRLIAEKLGSSSTGSVAIGIQKLSNGCATGSNDLRSKFTIRMVGNPI